MSVFSAYWNTATAQFSNIFIPIEIFALLRLQFAWNYFSFACNVARLQRSVKCGNGAAVRCKLANYRPFEICFTWTFAFDALALPAARRATCIVRTCDLLRWRQCALLLPQHLPPSRSLPLALSRIPDWTWMHAQFSI